MSVHNTKTWHEYGTRTSTPATKIPQSTEFACLFSNGPVVPFYMAPSPCKLKCGVPLWG